MQQSNRKLLSYILAFTLALSNVMFSSNVAAYELDKEEPTAGTMLVDGFMVRPITLAGTVVGAIFYVVTLPFSLLGGNAGDAGKVLVVDPFTYTFVRPLGEI